MKKTPRLLLVCLLFLLVGCDHVTKNMAKRQLEGRASVEVVSGVLDLRYVENHGSAFNLLRPIPPRARMALLVVANAAVLLLMLALWRRYFLASPLNQLALLLLLAGGLGNLVDRVARGYVVDFVHLHHWPVFNAADVFVVAGGGLLLLQMIRGKDRLKEAT